MYINPLEVRYADYPSYLENIPAVPINYFGWRSAVAHLKAPGASERLRHMCDQAVMDCVLTDKEKGLGVSTTLFSRSVVFVF